MPDIISLTGFTRGLFNLYFHFTKVINYEIPLDFKLIQNKVLILKKWMQIMHINLNTFKLSGNIINVFISVQQQIHECFLLCNSFLLFYFFYLKSIVIFSWKTHSPRVLKCHHLCHEIYHQIKVWSGAHISFLGFLQSVCSDWFLTRTDWIQIVWSKLQQRKVPAISLWIYHTCKQQSDRDASTNLKSKTEKQSMDRCWNNWSGGWGFYLQQNTDVNKWRS